MPYACNAGVEVNTSIFFCRLLLLDRWLRMRGLWVLQAIAIPLGIIIFIKGFLPLKSHNAGYSTERCCDQPKFSKVVLMVIDALKTGFVTPEWAEDWPYVYRAIRRGHGKIYNARVHPPTVTLPRVKVCHNHMPYTYNTAESELGLYPAKIF